MLDAHQIENFKQLLMKSTDVFALNDSELGCTDVVSQNIDTGDKLPVKQPPYRAPMIYREKITEMVMEMQERGIVQPSMSPWASPVILVPKKDGSLRFCADFRKLNALTKKDLYPLTLAQVLQSGVLFPCLGSVSFTGSFCLGILHRLATPKYFIPANLIAEMTQRYLEAIENKAVYLTVTFQKNCRFC